MPHNKMKTPRLIADLGEIYDMYRTAALNKAYYGELLARYQRRNTWLEIAIAVGATSSGLSGLAILNNWQYGKVAWGVITAASSVLAVTKPILQINKQVERYSKLFTGHLENFLALRSLVNKIRRQRRLTKEMIQEFEIAEQRFIDLSRSDDPNTNATVHGRCEEDVRKMLPDEIFWYPEAPPGSPRAEDKQQEVLEEKAESNVGTKENKLKSSPIVADPGAPAENADVDAKHPEVIGKRTKSNAVPKENASLKSPPVAAE
jgi:hypothetical protein